MAVQDLGFITVAEKFLHELSAPITVWSIVMLFTNGEKKKSDFNFNILVPALKQLCGRKKTFIHYWYKGKINTQNC